MNLAEVVCAVLVFAITGGAACSGIAVGAHSLLVAQDVQAANDCAADAAERYLIGRPLLAETANGVACRTEEVSANAPGNILLVATAGKAQTTLWLDTTSK